jgi:hypothetical protein
MTFAQLVSALFERRLNTHSTISNSVFACVMRKFLMIVFLIGTESIAAPPKDHAQLRCIVVKRSNIVVRGAYLGRVEVWVVPTGTGITEDEYTLVGTA